MHRMKTIEHHLFEEMAQFPALTTDLIGMLINISLTAKVIRKQIVMGGLVDGHGSIGETNIQGEDVQKLDIFANDCMKQLLGQHSVFAVMGSEEDDQVFIPSKRENAQYALLFDPLDGSSNIDVNVSVGTIFSIHKVADPHNGSLADCLQPGSQQVAAGYIIYGPSVMLVYTAGHGVHGFTYDPSIGEFLLSHHNLTIPKKNTYFSINEGNLAQLPPQIKDFLAHVKSKDSEKGLPLAARYVGSLVADFHRNLLKGGVFLYPGTTKKPEGKLRLLYEANPLAFICEQAGGAATNGDIRILDIQPKELHQRTSLFIGNKELVDWVHQFLKKA